MPLGTQTLLFDPRVQLLASVLLAEGSLELLPSLDNELGVRYLDVERVTGLEPTIVKTWLENLASKGILEARLVRKLVACPRCNSLDTEKSFGIPGTSHVCRRCGQPFNEENATLKELCAYRLSKDAESQLGSESSLLKPLAMTLADVGYSVSIGGVLRGASATDHRFNLVGVKEIDREKHETVVVDVVASDASLDASPVMVMFAKRYDTNADKSALVAMPGLVENGRKLASLYKISLIEARDFTEAALKLRSSLNV